MRGGRKNLKWAANNEAPIVKNGENIMQVVSLRGSNLIEVMDSKGDKSLVLFPAKFQKSVWIKRGSFVVVDQSGKQKALESGNKVTGILCQVLFHDQVRALQKSTSWPEIFTTTNLDEASESLQRHKFQLEESNESNSSEDDGLPPLVANINRVKPFSLRADDEIESGSDSDA